MHRKEFAALPRTQLPFARIETQRDLGAALHQLRRRYERDERSRELSYRDLEKLLKAKGSEYKGLDLSVSRSSLFNYFEGRAAIVSSATLDFIAECLGASPQERKQLADARDLIEDAKRDESRRAAQRKAAPAPRADQASARQRATSTPDPAGDGGAPRSRQRTTARYSARLRLALAALTVLAAASFGLAAGRDPHAPAPLAAAWFSARPLDVPVAPVLDGLRRQDRIDHGDHLDESGLNSEPRTASVHAFVFAEKRSTLCMAAGTGSALAGVEKDFVDAEPCDNDAGQIWVPSQYDAIGGNSTWLINYKYPNLCLDSNKFTQIDGPRIQLWPCHARGGENEMWDLGAVLRHQDSWPLCLELIDDPTCLGVEESGRKLAPAPIPRNIASVARD